MRLTTRVSSLALMAAMLASPALAQDVPRPSQGQEQAASEALGQARQQLRAAAQRLEEASRTNDAAAIEQARSDVRRAIDGVRQAMTRLSPEQRAELQESLRQAEEGMQIHDPAALAQAAQRLDRSVILATEQ